MASDLGLFFFKFFLHLKETKSRKYKWCSICVAYTRKKVENSHQMDTYHKGHGTTLDKYILLVYIIFKEGKNHFLS